MKVVVTSKENDIAVYHCLDIIENDGVISFIANGKVDVTSYDKKNIEIISIYMTEKR